MPSRSSLSSAAVLPLRQSLKITHIILLHYFGSFFWFFITFFCLNVWPSQFQPVSVAMATRWFPDLYNFTSALPSLPSSVSVLSLPLHCPACKRCHHIDLFFLASALHNLSLKSCHHLTVLMTQPVMLYRCVGVFVCLQTVCACVCVCKSKETTDMPASHTSFLWGEAVDATVNFASGNKHYSLDSVWLFLQ